MIAPLLAGTNFRLCLLASLGLATALTVLFDNTPTKAYNAAFLVAQTPATQTTAQTTQLFVNPVTGSDGGGNGSAQAPFKTITHALQMAGSDTVIELAPGTYSALTGESFPIELKPGVIIQGDPATKGRNIAIEGGGFYLSRTFARQNIAILGADRSGLAGVTVTNANRRGYGLWIESCSMVVADNTFSGNSHDGISVTGNGAPLIRNNYFANNGANGITIFNTARPQVRDNVFERTGFGIAIAQNSAPLIVGNRIVQNQDGIVVHGKAQPVLRNNTIESNIRDGLVATQQSLPDVGTQGQPGGNLFRNNRRYDINTSAASQTIAAFGNQIALGRTAGRLDMGTMVSMAAPLPQVETVTGTTPIPQRIPSPVSIQIPVPPPARATAPSDTVARRPRRRRATAIRRRNVRTAPPRTPTMAVEIPVPTPVSETPTQPTVLPVTPRSDRLPDLSVQPGLLPTPFQPSFERMPSVELPSNSPRAVGEPLPSNSTATVSSGYRVVVLVETLSQERQLRALAPDAVRLRSSSGIVMQVGVFRDRSSAEQMLQKMSAYGFNTTIEQSQ